jgi:hypothetical protein
MGLVFFNHKSIMTGTHGYIHYLKGLVMQIEVIYTQNTTVIAVCSPHVFVYHQQHQPFRLPASIPLDLKLV